VTIAFADRSFSGPMCFGDLKKALRMKLLGANGTIKAVPLAATVPGGMK
jgi:hypothetical protein